MLNCCLAQLSTFSIQQSSTMDTNLGSFKVPPSSLTVFTGLFIMVLAPMYDHAILPFARKITRTENGIMHLQRIGTGLVLSIVAIAVAALVETKRKKTALIHGLTNSTEPLPITFLWVALQYLFLGSADLFTLAGMMEFYFTEAPWSMRRMLSCVRSDGVPSRKGVVATKLRAIAPVGGIGGSTSHRSISVGCRLIRGQLGGGWGRWGLAERPLGFLGGRGIGSRRG
ncbi:hypothetical protein S83_023825 [Arachis hypogaea]